MQFINFINKPFGSYDIHGLYIEPTYWEAAAIIFLIFLLILVLARLRFIYLHWSLGKNSLSFLFYGFLLALIVEGFLILSGRTLFTEVIGWKSAPKPLSTILDAGRAKLVRVLGDQTQIPDSVAKNNIAPEDLYKTYQSMSPQDKIKTNTLICRPER